MSINLVCLPFAGGTKHSLKFLKGRLEDNVIYHSIEYPGRGSRILEESLTDLNGIVEDAYAQIKSLINMPYAIYGHSMGAVVGFLLTRKIAEMKQPGPLHLFVSGTDAPSVPAKEEPRYLLPKNDFIEKLKKLGGMPDEILNNDELLDFFEPILRADFQAIETFEYRKITPLSTGLTVMIGDKEDVEEEDVLKWQEETIQPLNYFKFPGDHFFIYKNEKEIAAIISDILKKELTTQDKQNV